MKKLTTSLFTTLNEAVNWVKSNKLDGCICPCCDQVVKVYKRKLNANMCINLINLYKMGLGFHHYTQFVGKTGASDFPKLKFWGLIESMENTDPEKKTSGYWKITDLGIKFVKNQWNIQKYAFIYNDELQIFSIDQTNIIKALGIKFDYQKLMEV